MEETEIVIIELCKIEEVNENTARLLFDMGIKNPDELANANANEIHDNLKKLKEAKKVSYLSDIKTIENWIANAKIGDYKFSYAKIRYESLKERAFEEDLRIIAFNELILNKQIEFDFESFNIAKSREIKEKFKESFNDMAVVRKNNKTIKDWEANNKTKLIDFKKKYFEEFEQNLSYEKFKEFYGDDGNDRICHYCKVTESEIKELHNNGRIITKRIYRRGKSHEIDRTNPNGKYESGNIELCCYWCNNAKTDEFDENDFKPIGNAIGEVWKERLNKIRK